MISTEISRVGTAIRTGYFTGWAVAATGIGLGAAACVGFESQAGAPRERGLNMLQAGGAVLGATALGLGALRTHGNIGTSLLKDSYPIMEGAAALGIGAGMLTADAATAAIRLSIPGTGD